MQEQRQQHQISFLSKRRQLMLQNLRNRREQIFNQTRQLLDISQNLNIMVNGNQNKQQKKKESPQINRSAEKIQSEIEQSVYLQECKSKQFKKQHQQKSSKIRKSSHLKHQYFKNFQFPQWLTQIPKGLNNYYFSLRPLAERVFIHILRRKMLVISMYGHVIDTVGVAKQQYNNSLFQGYYVRNNEEGSGNRGILIICDMLVWKQNPMTCSQFEFRIMWMMNNFGQGVIKGLLVNDVERKIDVKVMNFKAVEGDILTQTWVNRESKLEYKVDGILLYQKDGYYHHGVNPDALLWKDPHFTNISCQSQLNFLTLEQQISNNNNKQSSFFGQLDYQQDNILYTLDAISLVRIDRREIEEFTKSWQEKLYNKYIVRFTFDKMYENQFEEKNEQINQSTNRKQFMFPFAFINFRIISVHGVNHRIPDPMSKILWKYHHFQGATISFQTLISTIHKQQQLKIHTKSEQQVMELE